MDTFAELSEPAVWSDLVLVAPSCGSVIAVGRFDGRVRWVSTYRAADPAAAPVRPVPAADASRALLNRYRSTPVVCGRVLLAMPQDVPALLAFDVITGKPSAWNTEIAMGDALAIAGAHANTLVLCGPTLRGVDAGGTGKLLWDQRPPRGQFFTGPAVVVGQTVCAPTTAGVLQYDADTGKERPAYAVPSLRKLLAGDAARTALSDTGAARAFGVPAAR
jgi:hypothetical protein